MKELFDLLNGAHVAREAFGKGKAWFYQRLNGNIVNGKPAEFTTEQRTQLAAYLRQQAQKLLETAEMLEK